MSKARQKNRKPRGKPTQKRNPVWVMSYTDVIRNCRQSAITRAGSNRLFGIKLDDREEQNNDKRNAK